jgi:hypothetical protein
VDTEPSASIPRQGDAVQLQDLVRNDDPAEVLAEIRALVEEMHGPAAFESLQAAWDDTTALFEGRVPGYRACNTRFHDWRHTTDCLLAMVRLVHGAWADGFELPRNEVLLGLIAALLHDTGYIQEADDELGTGAKYTLIHVDRSIVYARTYLAERGYSQADFEFVRRCLKCTGLGVHLGDIYFPTREQEILGKMLGTADLYGQMADRGYLEKLVHLFQEFQEGGVPGYDEERDLLLNTSAFHTATLKRLNGQLGGVHRFMGSHFRARHRIDRDLYHDAILRGIEYLERILDQYPFDYRRHLRRSGLTLQVSGLE